MASRYVYWPCVILFGLALGLVVRKLARTSNPPSPREVGQALDGPRSAVTSEGERKSSSTHEAALPDSLSLLVPDSRFAVPSERAQAPAKHSAASPAQDFEEPQEGYIENSTRRRSGEASFRQDKGGLHPKPEGAAGSGLASPSALSTEPSGIRAVTPRGTSASEASLSGRSARRAFNARLSRRSFARNNQMAQRPFDAGMGALPPGAVVGDGVPGAGGETPGLPPEPTAPPPKAVVPEVGDEKDTYGDSSAAVDPRFGPEAPGPTPPKLYRIGVMGTEGWSDARELKETLDDLKTRLTVNAAYRVQIQEETAWSAWQNRDTVLSHIEWRLRTRYIGDLLAIGSVDALGKAERTWQVRIVRKDPKPAIPTELPPVGPADTIGNPKIDLLHGAVWNAFPDLESWGICNCRRIAKSDSWSQHAWCNGEDLHREVGGKNDQESMEPVALWLKANQSKYGIEHIIWRRDTKCDDPTYDHCNHIHVDMKPNGRGTPPCAG